MFSLPSGSDYNSHSPAGQSGPAPSATPSTLQPPQVRPAAGHAHYQALLWGGGRGCYRVVWLHHRTWGTPPDVLRQQRNSDNGRHSGIALTQEHTATTECCKSEVALCHNPFPFLVYCTLSQTYLFHNRLYVHKLKQYNLQTRLQKVIQVFQDHDQFLQQPFSVRKQNNNDITSISWQ